MTTIKLSAEDSRSRYVKIATFLRKRFTVNGYITVTIGGIDTKYAKLEKLAYAKYVLSL